MIDLNAFRPAGSSLQQLTHAFNINDRGERSNGRGVPPGVSPEDVESLDMFSYSSHARQARRTARIMGEHNHHDPKHSWTTTQAATRVTEGGPSPMGMVDRSVCD